MPLNAITAPTLPPTSLLDADVDVDAARRSERKKHLYGGVRDNQPQGCFRDPDKAGKCLTVHAEFVTKYGRATAFGEQFYSGLADGALPVWLSTTQATYTPKAPAAKGADPSAVAAFMNGTHFGIGDQDGKSETTSTTKRDYQPRNAESDASVASGASRAVLCHYPAVFRDEQHEKVPASSLYGSSYTNQQFRDRSRSAHMTVARKLGNRTNFDLGDEEEPDRWTSMTKRHIVPMKVEPVKAVEHVDKKRSTVLDAPDGEVQPWISVQRMDFAGVPGGGVEALGVDPAQLKADNKQAHFTLESDPSPVLDGSLSQYGASYLPFAEVESASQIRKSIKDQHTQRRFQLLSETSDDGASYAQLSSTSRDSYKRPFGSASVMPHPALRTLNANASAIVYGSEPSAPLESVMRASFQPVNTGSVPPHLPPGGAHPIGSNIFFRQEGTDIATQSTTKTAYRPCSASKLAADFRELVNAGKTVSRQQVQTSYELGNTTPQERFRTTLGDHAVKTGHADHRRTPLKPDMSYETSLRNTVAGLDSNKGMYSSTSRSAYTDASEYIRAAQPADLTAMREDHAQSVLQYETDSAQKYYISTAARSYLPPDVRRVKG
ncbi:hypothetical protein RI367_000922 [Sorochytrium milnesiophthora]